MKTKKLLVCMICLLLTGGCGVPAATVYDNDQKLASSGNSYNLTNYTQKTEEDTLYVTIEIFEGMDTIWEFTAEENQDLELICDLAVTSGKAKLVLIGPDNIVTTLAEAENKNAPDFSGLCKFNVQKGRNRLKLVGGKDTSLDLKLTIPEGTLKELGS